MPSIQTRLFGKIVRLIVKRKDWGGRDQLPKRARRIFGAPRIVSWLAARDTKIQAVRENGIRGEWISRKSRPDRTGILLYIHGGGYVSCSPRTHRPISCALARYTDLRVFSVQYDLAPENPFPASVEGVLAAYRWLVEKEPGLPIVLAGDSAGGGLVLTTIMRARDTGIQMPSCGVCFSAWTDMTGSGDSVQSNSERDQMFYPRNIEQFADVYLGVHDRRDTLASPVFGEFAGFPPILFHVSESELLADDSRRVYEKILQAAGESMIEMFKGVIHSWQMGAGFIPESDDSLRKAASFIQAHVNRSKMAGA